MQKDCKYIYVRILLMDKNIDSNYYSVPPFFQDTMNMYGNEFNAAGSIPPGSQQSNSTYTPPYGCQNGFETQAMFNPLFQYEQAYMYYRYLAMQMDYKIKCKEYEKLSSKTENSKDFQRENGRRIE